MPEGVKMETTSAPSYILNDWQYEHNDICDRLQIKRIWVN